MRNRETVAYQLSLFGEKPKPMGAFRPAFYTWKFMGCPMPFSDAAKRQYKTLYPNATRRAGKISTAHPPKNPDPSPEITTNA